MRPIDPMRLRSIGQPHVIIRDAGHFLQEEKGPEIARIVVDFMNGT